MTLFMSLLFYFSHINLVIHLSIYSFIPFFMHPCIHLLFKTSFYPFNYPFLHLFIYSIPIHSFIQGNLYLFIHPSWHLFVSFICPTMIPFIHLFQLLSIIISMIHLLNIVLFQAISLMFIYSTFMLLCIITFIAYMHYIQITSLLS